MGEVILSTWGDKAQKPSWLTQYGGRQFKAFIGWDGMVITDPDIDILAAMKAYYRIIQEHSCGRCIPCRLGTQVIYNVLNKIAAGIGVTSDLDFLKRTAVIVRDASKCRLGHSAKAVIDFLEHYGETIRPLLESNEITGKIQVTPKGIIRKEHFFEEITYKEIVKAPCRIGLLVLPEEVRSRKGA
ncbi:MAG: formate dehydrogenase beta subunit [Clostridia bacterium]|nr:formate dehydrogenase beta subunit [Clostridia bacterium]